MTDVLVAGGGLAGAACATALAQAGRAVVLIEREAAPRHKICGEFLSTEAQWYLARLGLDMAALGGHRITHVRLVRGTGCVAARLPFEGLGLTRNVLDEALLAHAGDTGVEIRRGQAIRRIGADGGISVEIGRAATERPRILMLATGKHEMRGAPRDARPSRLVGFKTYFALAPAQLAELSGHVELVLFPGGYAGLQRVENGAANFSLLVEARTLRNAGGNWPGLLDYLQRVSPHLARRLGGAQDQLPAPISIARLPFGFVHRPRRGDAGAVFRLGDQAAVIPSFTGDGMAIALHSAALAARFVCAGQDSAAYHGQLARDVAGQIRRAGLLHGMLAAPLLGPAVFAAAKILPQLLAVSAALTRVPVSARLANTA